MIANIMLVAIIFVSFLTGAIVGHRATAKEPLAIFDEQWKCTRNVPYYPKGKLERICNQWTRIK